MHTFVWKLVFFAHRKMQNKQLLENIVFFATSFLIWKLLTGTLWNFRRGADKLHQQLTVKFFVGMFFRWKKVHKMCTSLLDRWGFYLVTVAICSKRHFKPIFIRNCSIFWIYFGTIIKSFSAHFKGLRRRMTKTKRFFLYPFSDSIFTAN